MFAAARNDSELSLAAEVVFIPSWQTGKPETWRKKSKYHPPLFPLNLCLLPLPIRIANDPCIGLTAPPPFSPDQFLGPITPPSPCPWTESSFTPQPCYSSCSTTLIRTETFFGSLLPSKLTPYACRNPVCPGW